MSTKALIVCIAINLLISATLFSFGLERNAAIGLGITAFILGQLYERLVGKEQSHG